MSRSIELKSEIDGGEDGNDFDGPLESCDVKYESNQIYRVSHLMEYEDSQNVNNNVNQGKHIYSHSAANLNQERQVIGPSHQLERNQRRFGGIRRRYQLQEETSEKRRQYGYPKPRQIRVSKSCTKECDILGSGHDSERNRQRNLENTIYRTGLHADFMLDIISDEEGLEGNLSSDLEDRLDLRGLYHEAIARDSTCSLVSRSSSRASDVLSPYQGPKCTSTPKSVSYISSCAGGENFRGSDDDLNQFDMDSLDDMRLNQTESISIHLNSSQLSSSESSQAYDPDKERCLRETNENVPMGDKVEKHNLVKANSMLDNNDTKMNCPVNETKLSIKSESDQRGTEGGNPCVSIGSPKDTVNMLMEMYFQGATGKYPELDVNCSGQSHGYDAKNNHSDSDQEVEIITLSLGQEKKSFYERRDHNDVYHAGSRIDSLEDIEETAAARGVSSHTTPLVLANLSVDVHDDHLKRSESNVDYHSLLKDSEANDHLSGYLRQSKSLEETSMPPTTENICSVESVFSNFSENSEAIQSLNMLGRERRKYESDVEYLDNKNKMETSFVGHGETATSNLKKQNDCCDILGKNETLSAPTFDCNDAIVANTPTETGYHFIDSQDNGFVNQLPLNQDRYAPNTLSISAEITGKVLKDQTDAHCSALEESNREPCIETEVESQNGFGETDNSVADHGATISTSIGHDDIAICDGDGEDQIETDNINYDAIDNVGETPPPETINTGESSMTTVHKTSDFLSFLLSLKEAEPESLIRHRKVKRQKEKVVRDQTTSDENETEDEHHLGRRFPRGIDSPRHNSHVSPLSVEEKLVRNVRSAVPIKKRTAAGKKKQRKSNTKKKALVSDNPLSKPQQVNQMLAYRIQSNQGPHYIISSKQTGQDTNDDAEILRHLNTVPGSLNFYEGESIKTDLTSNVSVGQFLDLKSEQNILEKGMPDLETQPNKNAQNDVPQMQTNQKTDDDCESEKQFKHERESTRGFRSRVTDRPIFIYKSEQEILEDENIRDLETMISYLEFKFETKREQKESSSLEDDEIEVMPATNNESGEPKTDTQASFRIQRVMRQAPSILEQPRLNTLRLPKLNPGINHKVGTWDFNISRLFKGKTLIEDAVKSNIPGEMNVKIRKRKNKEVLNIKDTNSPYTSPIRGELGNYRTSYLDLLKTSPGSQAQKSTPPSKQSILKSPKKSKSLSDCTTKYPSASTSYRRECRDKEYRSALTNHDGEKPKTTSRSTVQEIKKTVSFSIEKDKKARSHDPHSEEMDDKDNWYSTVNAMLMRAEKVKLEMQARQDHRFPRSDSASVVHPVRKQGAVFLSHLLEQDKRERRLRQAEHKSNPFITGRRKERQSKQKRQSKKPESKSLVYYRYSDNVPDEIPLQKPPEINCAQNLVSTSRSAGILSIKTSASRAAQKRAFATHQRKVQVIQRRKKADTVSPKEEPSNVLARLSKPINFSSPNSRAIRMPPINDHKHSGQLCERANLNQNLYQLRFDPKEPEKQGARTISPCNMLIDRYSDVFDYYSMPYLNKRQPLVTAMYSNRNTNASSGSDYVEVNKETDFLAYPEIERTLTMNSNTKLDEKDTAMCSLEEVDFMSRESESLLHDQFATLSCKPSIERSTVLDSKKESIIDSCVGVPSGICKGKKALYLKYGLVGDLDALTANSPILNVVGKCIKAKPNNNYDHLKLEKMGQEQSSQLPLKWPNSNITSGQSLASVKHMFDGDKRRVENDPPSKRSNTSIHVQKIAFQSERNANNYFTDSQVHIMNEIENLTLANCERIQTAINTKPTITPDFISSKKSAQPLSILVRGKSVRLEERKGKNLSAPQKLIESMGPYGMMSKSPILSNDTVFSDSTPTAIPTTGSRHDKSPTPSISSGTVIFINHLSDSSQSIEGELKRFLSGTSISCCQNKGPLVSKVSEDSNSEIYSSYEADDDGSLGSHTWNEIIRCVPESYPEQRCKTEIGSVHESLGKPFYENCQKTTTYREEPTCPKLKDSAPSLGKDFLRKLRGSDLLSFIAKNEDRLLKCLKAVTQASHYLPTFHVKCLDPVTIESNMVRLHFCTTTDNFDYGESQAFKEEKKTSLVFYRNGRNGQLQSLFAVNDVPRGLYTLDDSKELFALPSANALPRSPPPDTVKLAKLVQYTMDALKEPLNIEGFYVFGPWMSNREAALRYQECLKESMGNDIEKYFQLVLDCTVALRNGLLVYYRRSLDCKVCSRDLSDEEAFSDMSYATTNSSNIYTYQTANNLSCAKVGAGKSISNTHIFDPKCVTRIATNKCISVEHLQKKTNATTRDNKTARPLQCKRIVATTTNLKRNTGVDNKCQTMAQKVSEQNKAKLAYNRSKIYKTNDLYSNMPMSQRSNSRSNLSIADGLSDEQYKMSFWNTNKIMRTVSPPPFYRMRTSNRVGTRRIPIVRGVNRGLAKVPRLTRREQQGSPSVDDDIDDESSSSSSSSAISPSVESSLSSSLTSSTHDSDAECPFEHFWCNTRHQVKTSAAVILRKFEEKPAARSARFARVRQMQTKERKRERLEEQEQIMYMRNLRTGAPNRERDKPCQKPPRRVINTAGCPDEFDFCPEVPLIKEMWEDIFPTTNFFDKKSNNMQTNQKNYISVRR